MGNKIRVLMTGAGAPGGPGIINALKKIDNIEIHVADINKHASGKFLSDKFFHIPKAVDNNFISSLLSYCEENKINIIFPLVTLELLKLAKNRELFNENNIKVIVSDFTHLKIANDKGGLYEHLSKHHIDVPNFYIVRENDDLIKKIYSLGYPKNPVVIKPSYGNGSRGIRVLDDSINKYDLLFNHKPTTIFSNIQDIEESIKGKRIPEMVVSEYLPGPELTIDTLIDNGKVLLCLIRERKTMSGGISTSGTFVEDENIEKYIIKIAETLPGLSGPIGFQVKQAVDGRFLLLESNPRIQGTSVAAMGLNINLPALAIKHAMGIKVKIAKKKSGISFSRYFSEVFYDN